MAPDADLVSRLQSGDGAAFVELVDRYHTPLLRLARTFVANQAVAEEVVQDVWLGVVRGIERFEGRSSLKTWLFRIMVNRARSTGVREHRETPVDLSVSEPAVSPDRFDRRGQWAEPPAAWAEEAEDRLAAKALAGRITGLLERLPEAQRQVVVMRDVEGLASAEVCSVLGISEGNQRVLLHRGRSRLRGMLEAERGNG